MSAWCRHPIRRGVRIGFAPWCSTTKRHTVPHQEFRHAVRGRRFFVTKLDTRAGTNAAWWRPGRQDRKLELPGDQGEPCTPIGARIKDRLRQRGPIMVFGYFDERNLYVPTREIVRGERLSGAGHPDPVRMPGWLGAGGRGRDGEGRPRHVWRKVRIAKED